jgi:hypothetical protein
LPDLPRKVGFSFYHPGGLMMETRKEKVRFRIQKLEERIAPAASVLLPQQAKGGQKGHANQNGQGKSAVAGSSGTPNVQVTLPSTAKAP